MAAECFTSRPTPDMFSRSAAVVCSENIRIEAFMTSSHIARQMWTRFEPLHAVTYFTPEARAAYEAVGLRGYWRGYFAGRFAPMGAVDATPVISSAFGFAPGMVTRAVPDVWSRATPAETL